MHGGWNNFGAWSDCTEECDGGTRSRNRSCDNPAPLNGGRDCEGAAFETESCNTNPCAG